jgi:hypothetical protein
MKGNLIIKILLGIIVLAVLIKFLSTVLVEPWVEKKIMAAWNEKNKDYQLEVERVRISLIASGIKLKKIRIYPNQDQAGDKDVDGEIGSVNIKGIKLAKAIFKKDIYIREIIISNINLIGKIPFPEDSLPATLSSQNIRIGRVLIDNANLEIENTLNAQGYLMQDGILVVRNIRIDKQDTLSFRILRQFDFKAEEFLYVSSDSFYTYRAVGLIYSDTSNNLVVDQLLIQPNYENYDFTSRFTYETDRFEAAFSHVILHDFPASAYIHSGRFESSYIEIGELNLKAFRDKRREFKHVNKPEFQDVIYDFPGDIRIDSIGVLSGNITYTEHAEESNEPGYISFNEIRAKIYKISNDSIYKTENAFIELKGRTLLMGKGRLNVSLKAKLFDNLNTFSLHGILTNMEAKELNPMLEKNAYVYATSGTIDTMNFSFTANSFKANGEMTLIYDGLDLAVKNRTTDDTTAFKERIISIIANWKVKDSNPTRGKDLREGIIDYERDPEKFLFNYCFKSILSGIQSSLKKNPSK